MLDQVVERGAGRPNMYDDGKMKRKSAVLPDGFWMLAKQVGEGNQSEGIRRMVSMVVQSNPELLAQLRAFGDEGYGIGPHAVQAEVA